MSEPSFKHDQIQAIKKRLDDERVKHGMTTYKLAEALKKLIEDKELRCRMGRNARQFAEERFSIKDVINAHLRMYESLK